MKLDDFHTYPLALPRSSALPSLAVAIVIVLALLHLAIPPGATLPANAENRGLNKQLQEQEQRSEALQRMVTENRDRVKIMDEHLKNVKQELTHTQRLVSAKAAEYKTEDHLQRLAENEVSGILLSIRKAESNAAQWEYNRFALIFALV